MSTDSYRRRILLAVTGLSPQVVTETVYALAVAQEMPWIPTEVHLITTSEGAKRARLSLLSEEPGWFGQLIEDYGLPEIAFNEDHIHVLRDAQDRPMEDIRSIEDNRLAADQITNRVRELTREGNSALHVSIAGGRKTMGFYLGYALSLYGRPQDRLSHVLVSAPFESSWNFFYPTPYSQVIELPNKELEDTRNASVMLAEIPFVPLRHGLDERLIHGEVAYVEAVESARRAFAPPRLRIDLRARRIEAAGRVFNVAPAELALLALLARRARDEADPIPTPRKSLPGQPCGDPELGRAFLSTYEEIVGEMGDTEETERALRHGMDQDYLASLLSKLRRRILDNLGPTAAEPYLVNRGRKRVGSYALELPPEAIEFGPVGEP